LKNILIVGAGLAGAVAARQIAEHGSFKAHVIDKRLHIGGNCHTERDEETGIMVHVYGPHIFHTDNPTVWTYIRKFGEFHPFTNRVKARSRKGVYSLPINLHTINQFFGKKMSPNEALEFLRQRADQSIKAPANFEEQALCMVGRELYEEFFRGYTLKQWGCDPKLLPASILKRLPVRFNYDDNYYTSRYQGMPVEGYSRIIERILTHERISVELGCEFHTDISLDYDWTIYTGPIDEYFGFSNGNLGYRTVFWEREVHSGDWQGNAVINYTSDDVPFTRVHEHKHFTPWEQFNQTICFTEFSKETERGDVPFYPKRLDSDLRMLSSYEHLAATSEGVSFLGRLATYRYQDMHMVIADSLDMAAHIATAMMEGSAVPRFPSTFRRVESIR
jgi:UDP-galactopyranose mutase